MKKQKSCRRKQCKNITARLVRLEPEHQHLQAEYNKQLKTIEQLSSTIASNKMHLATEHRARNEIALALARLGEALAKVANPQAW